MSKFSKLKQRLQLAEQRGYKNACIDVQKKILDKMETTCRNRPDQNIYKRTLLETYSGMYLFVGELLSHTPQKIYDIIDKWKEQTLKPLDK